MSGKKNSYFLNDICSELNSTADRSAVWNCAIDAVIRLESIDMVGVYILHHDTGEYSLDYNAGLPPAFIGSHSIIKPGSALHDILKCDGNVSPDSLKEDPFVSDGSTQVFLKAIFPLIFNETEVSVILVASSEAGVLAGEMLGMIETLVSMIKASIFRIAAEERSRMGEAKHSLLLQKIHDPILALSDCLRVQYCNTAFMQLICFENGTIEGVDFEEFADNELIEIMRYRFYEVLDSGKSCIVTCEYRDRLFNTSISRTADGLLVMMNDITEAEQTRKKLDFREKLESLLVNISTDFIEMRGNTLNLGINDALLNIGVAIEVDRAYLFQFNNELKIMNNTHEWCASNIQPMIDNMQNLKIDDYPWWMNKFSRNWTIYIPRLDDLPSWAEAERELLESRDVRSLLMVPITHRNGLMGSLGFDCVNQERYWSEDIIDLLRIVGNAIGNALARNEMEKKLIEMYKRAEKEAQINAVLLKEVSHRVKNNLSEIIGLLYAQKRFSLNNSDYDEFVNNLISRIRGLATVHDMLSSSGWNSLKLTKLARGIINNAIASASDSKKLKSSISSSSIRVNPNQAHALALILNELVRNSLKHALVNRDSLRIKVRMRMDRSGQITLTYSDNGPGYPSEVLEQNRKNLGLDLIQKLIIKNLQGELTLTNDGGASARINFSRAVMEDCTNESK